jgi:hypothetical protein
MPQSLALALMKSMAPMASMASMELRACPSPAPRGPPDRYHRKNRFLLTSMPPPASPTEMTCPNDGVERWIPKGTHNKAQARRRRSLGSGERAFPRHHDGHAVHPLARWTPAAALLWAFAQLDRLAAGHGRSPAELTGIHQRVQGPQTRPRFKPLRQDCVRRLTTPSARDGARPPCVSFHALFISLVKPARSSFRPFA